MTYAPCKSAAPCRAACLAFLITVLAALVACSGNRLKSEDTTDDSVLCSQVKQTPNIGYIATARPGANYHKLGQAIAFYANERNDFKLRSCITDGSKENLQLLRDTKSIVFALVQLDALHYNAVHDPPHDSAQPIRVVAYLYGEKVHLFVRNHLYLSSPANLAAFAVHPRDRQKVWLGPEQSGGYITASKVLQAAGVAGDDIERLGAHREDLKDPSKGWDRAEECLRDDPSCCQEERLSAFFRTMACPRPSQGRLSTTGVQTANTTARSVEAMLEADVQLMALSQELVDRLTEDGLYVPAMIPLGTYKNMKRGVATIGIPTVLVTNLSDDRHGVVSSLLEQVAANKSEIEDRLGGIELDLFDRRDRIAAVTVHPGAGEHFGSQTSWALWMSGIILFTVVAVAGRDPWWVRRGLAAGSYLLLLSATLGAIWLVLSLAMMQAEGTVNPDFSNPVDSLLHTFRLVSGQPGQSRLMTRQGEVWRWVGLFCFPVVCGWLLSDVIKGLLRRASVRLARVIRRAQARDAHRVLIALAKAPKRLIDWMLRRTVPAGGAIVFLNWDDRAASMLDEMKDEPVFANRPIVIVQSAASERAPDLGIQNVRVLEGDPAARRTLEEAGIADAAAVTIVSKWTPRNRRDRRRSLDPDAADTKTLLAISTIRAICEDRNRTRALPVTAEIVLARNQDAARSAAEGGKVEVTCMPA